MIGSLPSIMETNDSVAMATNGLTSKGLPLDYYATLPGKIQAVTHDDVQRVPSSTSMERSGRLRWLDPSA